ncbi:MAG: hypothetical protein DMF75_08425 [Acidobacteria bacterium]|nr:MAG: hypothetical protein DMF75_08425 [Acidobacteriota bacterium]
MRALSVAILVLLALAVLILTLTSFSIAQEPQHKLVQFQMAIMKKGPALVSTKEQERNQILQQHLANVLSLLDSGKAVIVGPFRDDTNVAGIFILRASSTAEAKTWVDADPAVRAGLMVPEMHPWWSEDIFQKANSPLKLNTVYFAFLKKGPNRKEGDDKNPEIQELQKAHIANIQRLAAMKKLLVAGPFGDNGDLRGIFVLRVASLKEAQDLCATDPMVKSGRLLVELHPWQVPEGVLP